MQYIVKGAIPHLTFSCTITLHGKYFKVYSKMFPSRTQLFPRIIYIT